MHVNLLGAERLSASKFIPPWIRYEHVARYRFAAQFVENRIVVDCACGTGEGTVQFLQSGASHVHAFDVSELAIQEARQHCRSNSVAFQVSDALQLPLPDGSADVFVSLETIEHINDDVAFVKEIVRVLKPKGFLICSTPNREITNPGLTLEDQPFNPFHVREYSAGEFSDLLAGHFSDVTFYGQNQRSEKSAKALARSAKIIGSKMVTRINQALKLPRFVFYSRAYPSVVKIESGLHYEYLVATCRKL